MVVTVVVPISVNAELMSAELINDTTNGFHKIDL